MGMHPFDQAGPRRVKQKVWKLTIDFDGNRKSQQMVTTFFWTKERAEAALSKEKLLCYQAAWISPVEVN